MSSQLSSPPAEVEATVVITTKNRKDDLRKAIASALAQDVHPEVLVVDDASTDGTADMVSGEFPQVSLHRSPQSQGYIVQRNLAAKLARGRFLFSIDDDAVFSSPGVVRQTIREFDHLRIGAVAIPFCNVNYSAQEYQRAPNTDQFYCIQQFIGTAHAVRRDLFLALGGYRVHYFHQGEERDFAIRALAAGYVVRLGNSDRIDHFESPKRDRRRMDYFGRRNDLLFTWHNLPASALPIQLVAQSLLAFKHIAKSGRVFSHLGGLARGYRDIIRYSRDREPVSANIYKLFRSLRNPLALCEFESVLNPLVSVENG